MTPGAGAERAAQQPLAEEELRQRRPRTARRAEALVPALERFAHGRVRLGRRAAPRPAAGGRSARRRGRRAATACRQRASARRPAAAGRPDRVDRRSATSRRGRRSGSERVGDAPRGGVAGRAAVIASPRSTITGVRTSTGSGDSVVAENGEAVGERLSTRGFRRTGDGLDERHEAPEEVELPAKRCVAAAPGRRSRVGATVAERAAQRASARCRWRRYLRVSD